MQRITIQRDGRPVGYLKMPDVAALPGNPIFPGIGGQQAGLTIATELGKVPVAALIYPWQGAGIELRHVILWAADRKPAGRTTRLPADSTIMQLTGDFHRATNDERVIVEFAAESVSRHHASGSLAFRIVIDDENRLGNVCCNVREDKGLGRRGFSGRFEIHNRELPFRELRFLFTTFGDHTEGELVGFSRSSAAEDSLALDYRLRFDLVGMLNGYGQGRFTGEATGLPFLWLLEQTTWRARTNRRLPFRIWLGAVRYAHELPGTSRAAHHAHERIKPQLPAR